VNAEWVNLPIFDYLNFGRWIKLRHPQIAINVKDLGFPNFALLDKSKQNMIVALCSVKLSFVFHYQKLAIFYLDFMVQRSYQ
jgi:hypothetical protein